MPYFSKPHIDMCKVLCLIYGVQNIIYRKLLCSSDIKPCNIMLGKIYVKSRIPNPVCNHSNV